MADFEKNYSDASKGMTAKNYGWYQCHLHHASKHIYNAGGKKVIKKLWKALKNHQENMSDEAFFKKNGQTETVRPWVSPPRS